MNPEHTPDDDAASETSSLSSVHSPQTSSLDEIRVTVRPPAAAASAFGEGVVASSASATSAPVHAIPPPTAANTTAIPKRTRKPREPKVEGKDEKPKEKKPRKPREPKVKTEDASAPAPAPRKRQKKEPAATAPDASAARPRQSTLTEMVSHYQPPAASASARPPQPQHILASQPLQRPNQPDIFIRDTLPPASKPPTPRPYSSGQNFDPIREAILAGPPLTQTSGEPSAFLLPEFLNRPPGPPPVPTRKTNGEPSPHLAPNFNRASASPSISSLIDPPSKPSAPLSYSSQTSMYPQQPPSFVGSAHHSPTPPKAAPAAPPPSASLQQPTPAPAPPQQQPQPPVPQSDGAMDVDGPTCDPPMKTQPSKSSSSAPTPQVQPKEKKAASPKAAGTGLLASNNLFGGPSTKQESEIRGPNIEIRISLNRDGGNTINLAQEIFKKYGQDAINPRAAAHRAKLLQVAAAQNKLEGGSADDMSVDLMSDMDGDSNIEMGGMDDEGKSATGADDAKPRKRRRKVEEYDKDDDFIDDTELAWQEKAAVAKDGFFVYSGKLVPEGTTANVESAAPSGRGRGGGRGRGRGRGGTTAASSTTAPATEKARDPNVPARGRGSRGGKVPGAPRKPRITKAEKEKLEAEKAQRERMMNAPPANSATPMSTTNSATPASLVQQQQQPPQQPSLGPQHHVYSNGTTGQQGVQV
ncbi:hypothetical protein CERZMDRAFT_95724 [Cercospora zeae-maydis SCOH1-5]|uniref:Hpc2-related domain-containing protein n=1 Tax=Cercospora zeae-maydis SCOH1-5 TaxID=717836 RepID=A0A6A6FLX2_9PEZI|nr:hypothetical protein CERZMDRAFT_95724 [Cercospora zeae-maydis SCOH1-5]